MLAFKIYQPFLLKHKNSKYPFYLEAFSLINLATIANYWDSHDERLHNFLNNEEFHYIFIQKQTSTGFDFFLY